MPKRPNFLILFTDQQRYDTIGAAGFSHMRTPNLDRLVREGCLFTNAYTPNPVCIPARHNLLTGLPARYHGYNANNSHPLDHALPTLPRIFSDAGYVTRAIGKMHFRPPRRHSGFDRMELMEEIPHVRDDDDYAQYLKAVGYGNVRNLHGVRNLLYMVPQRSLVPEAHHGTTWVADRCIDFINTEAGRRPFFLWAGWIAPHPPFNVPDEFADMYKNAVLPEPFSSETAQWFHAVQSKSMADLPRPELLRRMRELYFAAISHVDKNVGRVLDALERRGELDNTVVLFTSDHGEMLGDHGCFAKMQPYDSCARIPFVVRYPEQFRAGGSDGRFVDLNDVLPTFLDAAGLAYPGPLDLPGESVLRTDGRKDRDHQYMEFSANYNRWISLRDRRYKFNYFYGGGYEELFDLQDDPCESTNLLLLVPDEKIRAVRNGLRARLVEYESRWGLANYVTWGDFLKFEAYTPRHGRNRQFPKFVQNIRDPEELRAMNGQFEETVRAVGKEPLLRLSELDLTTWVKNGADPEWAEKIVREGL